MEHQIILNLQHALPAAADHLDYCGYGDKWERECALESKLDVQIKNALDETNEFLRRRQTTNQRKA